MLRSEGTGPFCAGASFQELQAISTIAQGKQFFSGFARLIVAMTRCPRFIIARVHGKAVGGGVGVCAAADYAYAVPEASVKLSELAVGIGPFVVGPVIERKIGLSAFSSLAVNATEWRVAEWAREHGLFAEVRDSVEEMDQAIADLASRLAASNPGCDGADEADLLGRHRALGQAAGRAGGDERDAGAVGVRAEGDRGADSRFDPLTFALRSA